MSAMRPPPVVPGGPCETKAMTVQPHVPEPLAAWMGPFMTGLTRPTWRHALVLVAGAILAPGRRTVAAMLRVVGLGRAPTFTNYHRVLNRNRWSGRAAARRLLHLLLAAFVPEGPVVIGVDETIERRWGAKIKARGIYRDPVRSSRGHFVKASGLRWLSLMVMVPIPWVGRRWALPFLTVLAPSERWSSEHDRRHKTLTDWARQAIRQVKRWLPAHHRRRRQLRRPRPDRRDPPPSLPDHKTADRCQPVRPGPAASIGTDGPATAERPALAKVRCRAGQSQDRLVADQRDGMVRQSAAQAGNRLRHRGLVSLRTAARADPLGAGARS